MQLNGPWLVNVRLVNILSQKLWQGDTIFVLVNGEVIGEATAPQKAEAKESASEKALATLSGRA